MREPLLADIVNKVLCNAALRRRMRSPRLGCGPRGGLVLSRDDKDLTAYPTVEKVAFQTRAFEEQ